MKILWLASWYPSEVAPFNGDFVQRHARAASLFNDVHIIYVVKDGTGTITKSTKKTVAKEGQLTETILYYYSPQGGMLGKLLSEWKYRFNFKKIINEHIAQYGKPHLVHVHVSMKAGIIARWIKKKYGIPYFVTEHWSGLLPEATPALNNFSFYYRNAYGNIIKNATAVSAVSNHLAVQIQKKFGVPKPSIISNVVNTALFKPVAKEANNFPKFIHISGLTFEKNGAAILQAFKILKDGGQIFKLDIFGSLDKELMQQSANLCLTKHIQFHPEVPQQELVSYLQQADALILYSRFETFGCVVIEAHACGTPVIASNIPALQELVEEGKNGFLVSLNNPAALAETLSTFIKNKTVFNREAIAATAAQKFNFKKVGQMFTDWYSKYLQLCCPAILLLAGCY